LVVLAQVDAAAVPPVAIEYDVGGVRGAESEGHPLIVQ
jgi:hypothetical protein